MDSSNDTSASRECVRASGGGSASRRISERCGLAGAAGAAGAACPVRRSGFRSRGTASRACARALRSAARDRAVSGRSSPRAWWPWLSCGFAESAHAGRRRRANNQNRRSVMTGSMIRPPWVGSGIAAAKEREATPFAYGPTWLAWWWWRSEPHGASPARRNVMKHLVLVDDVADRCGACAGLRRRHRRCQDAMPGRVRGRSPTWARPARKASTSPGAPTPGTDAMGPASPTAKTAPRSPPVSKACAPCAACRAGAQHRQEQLLVHVAAAHDRLPGRRRDHQASVGNQKAVDDCMRAFDGSDAPPSCMAGITVQPQPPGAAPAARK